MVSYRELATNALFRDYLEAGKLPDDLDINTLTGHVAKSTCGLGWGQIVKIHRTAKKTFLFAVSTNEMMSISSIDNRAKRMIIKGIQECDPAFQLLKYYHLSSDRATVESLASVIHDIAPIPFQCAVSLLGGEVLDRENVLYQTS